MMCGLYQMHVHVVYKVRHLGHVLYYLYFVRWSLSILESKEKVKDSEKVDMLKANIPDAHVSILRTSTTRVWRTSEQYPDIKMSVWVRAQ